jgi:hypothetical protein
VSLASSRALAPAAKNPTRVAARRRHPVYNPSSSPNPEGEHMAKAKKGKGGASARPTEMLLVSSKVRQLIKDAGCNTAGDALDGLNAYVGWLVQQAAKRASENGRKTVRAHDFIIM